MAGKPNVKPQRAKAKPAVNVSPPAPQINEEVQNAPPDLSILRKSISTSITGFTQAREVFETGTPELKQLLGNECDIVYECRVCRNLFRSLANFISHKRIYCVEKFSALLHPHFNNNSFMKDDLLSIIQNEENYQEYIKNKNEIDNNDKNGISSDALKNNITSKDLTSIIERLVLRKKNENSTETEDMEFESTNKVHTRLQSIPDTRNAVYQNIYCDNIVPRDLIKDEVMELDKIISSNEGVLGPDGKLLPQNHLGSVSSFTNDNLRNDNERIGLCDDLYCNICKINFSTIKTLKFHMKHKHAENRLVYPCPDCTDTFSNTWSVFRHLFKIHRKSATDIRKLRESIQNKAFKLDTSALLEKPSDTETPVETITEQQRMDQENQAWIDNLERDGDIPRCGGCGKRFERRAALSSHRQTCQLRKSAQNKINSNVNRKTVKSSNKDVEDPVFSEPLQKIPKLDKSMEKRIEIKIRKDYIKTSPITVRTASPSLIGDDDSSAMELTDNVSTPNGTFQIGENDLDSINSDSLTNAEHCNDDSIVKTVKDYDDANVDSNNQKNSIEGIHCESDIDVDGAVDAEVNEISKLCDEENSMNSNKAYGQNGKSPTQNSGTQHLKMEIDDDNPYDTPTEINNFSTDMFNKKEYEPLDLLTQLDDSELFQCEYCSVIFTAKKQLERHVVRHLIWKKFECELCGIKSCNLTQYRKHMKCSHHIVANSRNSLKDKISKTNNESTNTVDKKQLKSSNEDLSTGIFIDTVNADNEESQSSFSKNNTVVKKYKPRFIRSIRKRKNFIKKSQENKKKTYGNRDSLDTFDDAKLNMSDADSQCIIDNMNVDPLEDKYYADLKIKLTNSKSGKAAIPLTQELNQDESDSKKLDQHIASSESYTVRRPVRNRTKHFDKDFEYDSSYLPKIKVASKESSITRVFSQKSLLKRKQFLQNETIAVEATNTPEETNQSNQKEETPIRKLHQGALQKISLNAASQGKSMMKQRQLIVTRRNTPSFIKNPYRAVMKTQESQKATQEKYILIGHPPTSHHGNMKKAIAQMKAKPLKFIQTLTTVSKTSDKSSLEKVQLKIGTSATSSRRNSTTSIKEEKSNLLPLLRKKLNVKLQTLTTQTTNSTKLDHQALSSDKNVSEEITMLNKSQYKNTSGKEAEKVQSSLSILPSNGKTNSSFVNISLKQLKDMQKVKNVCNSPVKNVSKNISVLKNLEENNEIRICKINQLKNKDIDDESKAKQSTEVIDVNKVNSNTQPKRIINMKNLLSPKNKHLFGPKRCFNMDKNNEIEPFVYKNTKLKIDEFLQIEMSEEDSI